jgi:hypothetical protein
MSETAFPLEELAPELPLQRLNCPGEGGLRNDAFSSAARVKFSVRAAARK